MKKTDELTVNNQNMIRMFLITAYIAIHSPMFLRFLSRRNEDSELSIFPVITLLCAVFILLLEITDYFSWKYEPPAGIRNILFILRTVPFIITLVIRSTDLYAFIFGPLVIFYAVFLFKKGIREIIFAAVLVISFAVPYFAEAPVHFKGEPSETVLIFLDILRLGKVIFFYVMGILLLEDKKSIVKNRELLSELKDSNKKITEYASKIADTVAVEERNRLARDIHDSIGHYLTATNIQLAKAKAFFSIDPDASLKAIENAQKASKEAMEDVRDSVRSLKNMENLSFPEVIKDIIKRIEGNGIEISHSITGNEKGCSYAVTLALYRVIQEALTNAVKHSGCSTVNIAVNFESSRASVGISDNGCGFSPDNIPETSSGISGIRQRIELVRGDIEITSIKGEGTVITASAPFDPVSTS